MKGGLPVAQGRMLLLRGSRFLKGEGRVRLLLMRNESMVARGELFGAC